MDVGHEETEKILKEIEARLHKEYKKATDEVQGKLRDYLNRFAKKDETWRKWVNDAKGTPEHKKRLKEYQEWRTGQMAIGKRWQEMKETLAEDYHHTNEIARSITYGYMPEVYALNHNYGTFQVEKGSKVDTSYTLYDRQTVERLMRDNPQLLPNPGAKTAARIAAGKDIRWNKQQIQSVMMQGILQGKSIPALATSLAQTVGDKNRNSAIRNARTMTTGAQNAGRVDSYKRANDMGIKTRKQWLATLDGRTRHTHRQLDGEIVDNDDRFSNGCEFPGDPKGDASEIYNCFVGSVNVATDSSVVRSYKHKYKGELFTVKTAAGVCFTCTPNHPILTDRGWIGAQFLNEGDNLIVTFISDKHFTGRYPNINHVFTCFDALHKFLNKLGGERTCILGVDFHGDIAASDVEIITHKGFLGDNGDTFKFEKQDKLLFKNSNKTLMCKRTFMKHLGGIFYTTLGIMRRFRKSLSFLWGSVSHAIIHSFGTVSDGNVVLSEYSIDNLPTNTIIRSELLNGIPGKVFLDNIISIERSVSDCHVYNLQTENGYYYVNSSIPKTESMFNGIVAIAKNCRCSLIPAIKGHEIDVKNTDLRHNSKLEGMSYEEWKKGKAQSNPLTLPEEKAKAIKNAYIAEYRRKAKSIK